MRDRLALAFLVGAIVASCGGDTSIVADQPATSPTTADATSDPSSTNSSAPTSAPIVTTASTVTTESPVEGVADIAVTEVVFGDHVTVTNLGAGSVSLDGRWLCNRPFYVPLPNRSLEPGESIETAAGPLGDLDMVGGEVAIYLSDDFEDADEMLDYVAWGRGGGRTEAAVEVGLWPEGDAVVPAGAGIESPGGGGSSADWN